MTRYLTSYRLFILSKLGLGLAYLWVCWDFLRINLALHNHLHELLPDLATEVVCGNAWLNSSIIRFLLFVSQPMAVWCYFGLSPLAIGLYVWGGFRWLQVGLGLW